MGERRESSGTLDSIHWRVTVECEEEKGREEVRTGLWGDVVRAGSSPDPLIDEIDGGVPRRLLRSPAGRRRGRQHLEAAAGPAVLPLGLLPPHVSEGTHSTVGIGTRDRGNRFGQVESCFDPSTGQWNMVAPMITARIRHGVAAANGKLYAVGGMDEDAFELRSVECFDS